MLLRRKSSSLPSWSSSCPLHNNLVTTQHPYRSMCPTPSSLQVWALTRIAVEPLCPGFIPTRDSIFRSEEGRPIPMYSSTLWWSVSQSVTMWFSTNGMNRTCSTERVDGRPDRDSLPTNRIIIKDYENWCFLASIVAVFLFFALSIKEFGNAMQHFNGNRHLS